MDKKLKRMEIARTGSFGADGAAITLQDLKDVKETFDGRGPVSLGHYMTKQDWWPQWGNIETIELIEDENGTDGVLEADVSLVPELAQAIDEGFYSGWSISIPARASDGKKYIHHLAMLGSVPPKIRDLKIMKEVGSAKPENAIEATGEGTAFGDYAFFNFADFPKEETKPDAPAATPPADPQDPPTAKTDPPAPDFSDLQKKTEKVKKIYKDGVRAQLVSAIGDRWPAGMKSKLGEFADKLVEAHDYEFADDGQESSLVQFFISLIQGMTPAESRPPVGRNKDFSDAGKREKDVDRAAMAQRF